MKEGTFLVAECISRMNNDTYAHFNRISFKCGNPVFIKLNHDNNSKHRRHRLDGFYEPGIWKIVERAPEHSFGIEKDGENNW